MYVSLDSAAQPFLAGQPDLVIHKSKGFRRVPKAKGCQKGSLTDDGMERQYLKSYLI